MTIRFIRFSSQDAGDQLGLLRDDEAVVNLSPLIKAGALPQVAWEHDSQATLITMLELGSILADPLRSIAESEIPIGQRSDVQLAVPVQPPLIIATGWNFADHVHESSSLVNAVIPATPTGFVKLNSALVATDAPVIRPDRVKELDYEIELAVVLSKSVYRPDREQAESAIGGFTLMNDVSARDVQEPEMKAGLLLAGKNFPTFAPLGPSIVPSWDFDVSASRLVTRINDHIQQDVMAVKATHSLVDLVVYWSSVFPLPAGSVVTLGSPPGVAYGGHGVYLKPGDVMELTEPHIGTLRNWIEQDS
jgi:2-keto-4-pentenoate hydratase/2-oxohepta-3-ene-1,7-dioic acid hydratase in catechol pathway